MRKITKEIVEAFLSQTQRTVGNSSVVCEGDEVKLALHGNVIAKTTKLFPKQVWIYHCGWKTKTTQERLNGLLTMAFPHSNLGVIQKNFVWYFTDCNGELHTFDKPLVIDCGEVINQ